MFPLRLPLFGALLLAALSARANALDDIAGQVVGQAGGQEIVLPLLKSDYDIDIQGDIARISLTQVFENPSSVPMQARYLFPLNQKAAVHAMKMRIGDEVVEAVIRKKETAKAEFVAAQKQGKAAALLTQYRPNMFTQNIANLMPGLPVEVTLSYVQPVPKIDGAYELVVPMVVGPRYQGAPAHDSAETETVSGWAIGPVPDHPPTAGVDLPQSIEAERVALDLSLTAPVPVDSFSSATHALATGEADGVITAQFADGRVIDNADFILRYTLGGEEVTAGILTHRDAAGGVLSLMIEPPRLADEAQAAPRELVFVLDTSGSMHGAPMAASKRFMAAAIDGLRPHDHFRIISFSNTASHFSSIALPATPRNLDAARAHIRGLNASGGTEIDIAIRSAFATDTPQGATRYVVFLSDGYIGHEASVLRSIRSMIGDARIYAFGVGSSVNRYLLDAMADEGRGYARYVGIDENGHEVAQTLARDLKTPLLTDISIDWGELAVGEATPARLPDLFDGGSLRVLGRYAATGTHTIHVNGKVAGRPASLPVELTLPDAPTGAATAALPLMWARARIADHERAIAVRDGSAEAHEAEITRLGLAHSLQTRFTSFVAVSRQIVNSSGEAGQHSQVALHKPKGVSSQAFPAAANGVVGSSTPEPEMLLGAILVGAMGWLRFHAARRRNGRAA